MKIILVTGTSKGIGKALIQHYASNGFFVIGCSRSESKYQNDNYQHFCLNISDEKQVIEMFSEIRKKYKRLDIVINNAGVLSTNYSLLTPLKTVQDTFSINMFGAFLICRESVKLMKENSFGRIINMSSIAVPLSSPGSSVYSSSKAALEQFSKVFAKEISSFGITVNTLGLSFVKDSGMITQITEKVVSDTVNQTIMKSVISVEDIINAIDFIINEKSKMITGQTLYLGGI